MDLGYTDDDLRRLLDQLNPASETAKSLGVDIARRTRMLPRRLYHYTDTNALIGMVTNKEVWATNAGFLNDDTELKWSSKIFDRVINSIKPTDADEETLLSRMRQVTDISDSGVSFYFASFSESADDLNQWRGYGDSQTPVCIGFNAYFLKDYSSPAELISVIYEESEQESIARDIVDLTLDYFRSNGDTTNPANAHHFIPHCVHIFRDIAAYTGLRFKSPQWKSENEWRLVAATSSLDGSEKTVSYRSGPHSLIPYMKLKTKTPAPEWAMPIVELIAGPTANRELAAKSLRMYMMANSYQMVEVKASAVTLRR